MRRSSNTSPTISVRGERERIDSGSIGLGVSKDRTRLLPPWPGVAPPNSAPENTSDGASPVSAPLIMGDVVAFIAFLSARASPSAGRRPFGPGDGHWRPQTRRGGSALRGRSACSPRLSGPPGSVAQTHSRVRSGIVPRTRPRRLAAHTAIRRGRCIAAETGPATTIRPPQRLRLRRTPGYSGCNVPHCLDTSTMNRGSGGFGGGSLQGMGHGSRAVGRAGLATCPSWRAKRRYLKRSSKACRPDLGAAACVSRSTVVRGFQSVQSLRASFTAILDAIGCRHCRRAPGSKNAHCVHAWSSAPHLPHRALLTSALDSSPAQRAQRITSLHFIRFGARGPSGWAARGRGFCARGARGVFRSSSWYSRCRYLRSAIAPSRPCSRAPLQPAPTRGPRFPVSKARRKPSLRMWRRPGSAVSCVRSPARAGWAGGATPPLGAWLLLARPTELDGGAFPVVIRRHVCGPDNPREAARSAARTLPRFRRHGETMPRSISLRVKGT